MEARWRPIPLLLTLAAFATGLFAQEKFSVHAKFDPAEARPGDEVTLVLEAEVAEGWHAYGTKEETNVPVSLDVSTMQLGGLEAIGEPRVPPGKPTQTPFGMTQFPLPEHFAVRLKLKVPAGASGEVAVSGELGYQICDANSCLAPDTAAFAAKLKVAAAATEGPAAQQPEGDKPGVNKPITIPGLKPGLQLAPDAKLTLKARFEPATARAGEQVTLVLEAHVIDGWHAYGTKETINLPVSFKHDEQQMGVLEFAGEAEVPEGELSTAAFGMEQYPLPHDFEVKQRVVVPETATPGEVKARGTMGYQLCDANSCDQAADAPWSATLTIEAGAVRAEHQAASVTPPAASASAGPKKNGGFDGWWGLILACIGGGLFALAMPCTYPMIPITFSFFTKQAEQRNGNVLSLALIYGFGIVAMFVLLGLPLGQLMTLVANHWVTNSIIGIVFLLFAFNLFGWITIEPPRALQNLAGKASRTGGLLGVFFMGATLVITSFTCTAPIVGALLPNIATYGVFKVGIGMAVFGLTMAAPFVVLSLMPTKVKAMPRSGEWMETIKVSLGFVELAATLKFVSMVDIALDWGALPRELFLMLIAAIFLMWAMYLFGILRKAGTVNQGVGGGRMGTGMGVVLVATYMLYGASGYQLDYYMSGFVPLYSAQRVIEERPTVAAVDGATEGAHQAASGHVIVWDDGVKALEVAKAEDKLLLYNFTGFNCVNCRAMENYVFHDAAVAALMKSGFVEGRCHIDLQKHLTEAQFAANQALQKRMTTSIGMPHFVVVDPKTGNKLGETPVVGFTPSAQTENWLAFLKEMLAAAGRG